MMRRLSAVDFGCHVSVKAVRTESRTSSACSASSSRTTISSKVINVDLDITDQTADIDTTGVPRPIKVRVLASAIVSVGDSDALIKAAANRFFSKPEKDQLETLTDLLSSSGRRAINLLTHDQLFSAKTAHGRHAPRCQR